MACAPALPVPVRLDPQPAPAALARVVLVAPEDPAVRVRVVLAARVALVAPVARVRVVLAVRRWVVLVPVALVARAQVARVGRAQVVPVVLGVPVDLAATVRTASAVHRARSRVPVVAATWKNCNRSS